MDVFSDTVEIIRNSANTVALTGAGISKASGLPTFRDMDGLWRQQGAMEWSNRRSFDQNPLSWYETFWQFHQKRLSVAPSLAHHALSDMIEREKISATITQNIDGLDTQAGTPPTKLLEIHGHDRLLSCTSCEYQTPTESWLSNHQTSVVPECPDGHVLKPNILLFGLDKVPGLDATHSAALEMINAADTLMVIGTTLEIPYVADWVFDFADADKCVIVVNPQRTLADTAASLIIRDTADNILPRIRDVIT